MREIFEARVPNHSRVRMALSFFPYSLVVNVHQCSIVIRNFLWSMNMLYKHKMCIVVIDDVVQHALRPKSMLHGPWNIM